MISLGTPCRSYICIHCGAFPAGQVAEKRGKVYIHSIAGASGIHRMTLPAFHTTKKAGQGNMDNSLASMIEEAQGAPSFFGKDSKKGDSITGRIISWSIRQTRDFRTNKPETWEDGSPKQQVVIIVQSEKLAVGDDDGKRSLYVKWWGKMRKDFAAAVTMGGYGDIAKDGVLTMAYSGDQPASEVVKGFDAEKYFSFVYTE